MIKAVRAFIVVGSMLAAWAVAMQQNYEGPMAKIVPLVSRDPSLAFDRAELP